MNAKITSTSDVDGVMHRMCSALEQMRQATANLESSTRSMECMIEAMEKREAENRAALDSTFELLRRSEEMFPAGAVRAIKAALDQNRDMGCEVKP
jgi:GTP cyclohydrolase FolE2